MSKFRLALVRQKYRPDGGAERFVSRALEALDSSHLQLNVITREWQGPVKPDWQIHICNPRKWGRISRERGFANAARALWQRESFDLVQSHGNIYFVHIFIIVSHTGFIIFKLLNFFTNSNPIHFVNYRNFSIFF